MKLTGVKDINNNLVPTFEQLQKEWKEATAHLKPLTKEEKDPFNYLKQGNKNKVDPFERIFELSEVIPALTKDDKNRLESCILNMIETLAGVRKKYNPQTLFYVACTKEIEELRELLNKVCE